MPGCWGHTPPLLQVQCLYEGANPNLTYDLKAALSENRDGRFHGGGWTRQVAIPQGKATNEFRAIWEFAGFPRKTPHIYFRLSYRDKETGQEGQLDFELPGTGHLRTRKMGSQ